MPTVDDRINRLRELKAEKEADKNQARAAKLDDFIKRAKDLMRLYIELKRSDIDIPEEFLSLDKGPGCFFSDDYGPGLRFLLSADSVKAVPGFVLIINRKKYVAVYKIRSLSFLQEVWDGEEKSSRPFSDEDIDVLGRRLSEFEGCFYWWFDNVFDVKENKDAGKV